MVVALRDARSLNSLSPLDPPRSRRPRVVARNGVRVDPIRSLVGPDLRRALRVPGRQPLYGRDAELTVLRAALDEAVAGRGRLVLVGGEAGIGKTSLVQALAAEATAAGVAVLAGGCDDLGTTPPYGPWIELLRAYEPDDDPARTDLPPLPPGLANADVFGTLSGQDALFGQAHAFVVEVAERRPLLLILEDQHWADQASLDLLRFLGRHLATIPAMFVVTYRDAASIGASAAGDPFARTLPHLVRDAAALRLDLHRLAADDVHRLTADRYALSPTDEERLVAYLQRYAEGNPFFAEELLRTLEREGVLRPRPGNRLWMLTDLSQVQVPPLVRHVVAERATQLGDAERRLAQLAAVIGTTVALDLWQETAGVSEDELIATVETALAAGLLVETADRHGLRFRHALIREALYEEVVLPRRRAWHRRIAEILAARPQPDPDAVAHHFVQAGDARAAHWLVEAGHRAARRDATRDAIDRYEAALARFPEDPANAEERGWLLWELAETHRTTDTRRSFEYLDQADRLGLPGEAPALAACLRWSRLRLRAVRGESVLDELFETAAAFEALPAAERARVATIASRPAPSRAILVQWTALHGRYEQALAEGLSSLASAPSSAVLDKARLCELGDVHAGLGLAYAAVGRPALAREAMERARGYAAATGSRFMSAWIARWELREVLLPYAAEDLAARVALAAEYAETYGRLDGYPTDRLGRPVLPLLPLLLLEGDWARAEDAATSFLGYDNWRIDALVTLATLDRLRGSEAAAWTRVRAALPDGPLTQPGTVSFVGRLAAVRLAAELALDAGRPDEALPWLAAHDRWLDWSGRTADRTAGLLLWARYSLVDGDPERAAGFAREALVRAREPRQSLAELAASRFLGELATADGDLAAAERHFAAALAIADACAAPYERAVTLLARAELGIARGEIEAAAADLAAARTIVVRLDARSALARAEAIEARLTTARDAASAAGSASGLRNPDAEGATRRALPGGLSPREWEVLRLVARGATDAEVGTRLFISPRTVARHLQSVYTKLGVNSRTAAAAFAFERGMV
jgi:DNA-binding NarL/FixJ family response regulator